MDEKQQQFLEEVKRRVTVMDGENPLQSIQDAIRIAIRAGILYRYADNGDSFDVRWTQAHSPIPVRRTQLCLTLMKRIVSQFPIAASDAKAEPVQEIQPPLISEGVMVEVSDIAYTTVDGPERLPIEDEIKLYREINPEVAITDAAIRLLIENDVSYQECSATGADAQITVSDVRHYLKSLEE